MSKNNISNFKIELLLIFGVTILFSCANHDNQNNLEGHWHVVDNDKSHEAFLEFPTFDILNDTLAVLGKGMYGYQGINGYLDKVNQKLYFGGECFMSNFKYKIIDSKIHLAHLNDTLDNYKYFATKCDEYCCDKQSEFFYSSNIEIDLPIKNDSFRNFVILDLWLQNKVLIGPPLASLKNEYGTSSKLVIGDKYSKIEDLNLWEEIVKVKIPVQKRDSILRVIYADKETPLDEINPILEYWEENFEHRKTYLAFREYKTNKSLNLWYLEINSKTTREQIDKTLSQWIND